MSDHFSKLFVNVNCDNYKQKNREKTSILGRVLGKASFINHDSWATPNLPPRSSCMPLPDRLPFVLPLIPFVVFSRILVLHAKPPSLRHSSSTAASTFFLFPLFPSLPLLSLGWSLLHAFFYDKKREFVPNQRTFKNFREKT